jgi:hypothetical protein
MSALDLERVLTNLLHPGPDRVTREDEVQGIRYQAEVGDSGPLDLDDPRLLDALAVIGADPGEPGSVLSDVAEAFAFLWLSRDSVDRARYGRLLPVVRDEVVAALRANKSALADELTDR